MSTPTPHSDEKSNPFSHTAQAVKSTRGRSFDEWIARERPAGIMVLLLILASAVSVIIHHWGAPAPYIFALGSCALSAATAIVFATRAPAFVLLIMTALLVAKLLALAAALT